MELNNQQYSINHTQLSLPVKEFEKLSDSEILAHGDIQVTDMQTNTLVTPHVRLDKNAVDTKKLNEVQTVPLYFNLTNGNQILIGYLDLTLTRSSMRKVMKWITTFIAIVVLIGIVLAVHQHHVNQQNTATNSSQNSQIQNNNSHIQHNDNKLAQDATDIKLLKQQVTNLQNAVQQYQNTQNKQAFDNELNNIQQEINQVKQQQNNQNSEIADLLTRINEALNNLENATPQQASQFLHQYHLD